jgi:antitoxin MazE
MSRQKLPIKKWGNSTSVRIPVAVMQATSLSLDKTVDIEYDLTQLLAGITLDNVHAEVGFGPAIGKEVV